MNNFIPGVASCSDVMKGRAANAATASSSLVLQTKIENQKPFSTNNSHTDVYTTSNRKPLATIPPSLSEQIQNKLSGKFQLKSVYGNEMMNAKHIARRSPEKVDNMQAALEKKLAQMRNFIRVEEVDSDCDDNDDTSAYNDFDNDRRQNL